VAVNRNKVVLSLSPSTHSQHVSSRAGHLQVNIFFEAFFEGNSFKENIHLKMARTGQNM
jgi:hypothetical protein